MRIDTLLTRVQADLQRGVETVERARLDREGETRVFLTVDGVDVDLPVDPAVGDGSSDGGTDDRGRETADPGDVEVTPGSGDGRLRFSFVPSKIGPLESAPDFPLTYLEGIGDATARKLRDAGVTSVRELARTDPRSLTVDGGLADARAAKFVEMARLVKLGADNHLAEAVVDLGFDRDDLARTSREAIVERLAEAKDAGELSIPQGYRFDPAAVEPIVSRATLTGLVSGRVDPESVAIQPGRDPVVDVDRHNADTGR